MCRVLTEVAFYARRAGWRGDGPAGGEGVAGKRGVPRGRGGGGDTVVLKVAVRFASLYFVFLVHAGVVNVLLLYFTFEETLFRRVQVGVEDVIQKVCMNVQKKKNEIDL